MQKIQEYERQENPAARFVRFLDKIMTKLTHYLNNGKALDAIDMNYTKLRYKHAQQGIELNKQYPEFTKIFELFVESCNLAELVAEPPF